MREPTIYDITAAVVEEDGIVMALFDNRYNAIKVIKPYVAEVKDEKGVVISREARLTAADPDGAERLYWLGKFGMITEDELQIEASKLSSSTERQKLYELLKKEFE